MLLQQLQEEYKSSLKAKEKNKKEILSFVIAQIKNKQIDMKAELSDDEIIKVIKKEIKTRQESISYMQHSGDQESINIELAKIAILEKYLPNQLSADKLKEIVQNKVTELGIADFHKQRGQLIGSVMKEYGGQVDGGLLNQIITDLHQQ